MDKGEDISGTLNHPVKAADIYTTNIGEDAVQKQYLEEIGLVAASMAEKYDETLKATLNKEAEERRNNKKEETPDASDTPDAPDANQENSSLDGDETDDEDNSMSNDIPF